MTYFWSSFLSWLGIAVDYVIAGAMIAGGAYLAVLFDLNITNPLYWILRPLRWVGIGLVACGIILGSYTYGKSIGTVGGAAACYKEWERKNYEAQIEKLKQEAETKALAAENAEKALNEIMNQADSLQKQVDEYADELKKFPLSVADCRRATADDDRRLCQLTGNTAAGCESTPTKRKPSKTRTAPKNSQK